MTGIPNTTVGQEYWMRCPECGDSENHNKAHLSINLGTGAFHCLRCGFSGYLTLSQVLKLVGAVDSFEINAKNTIAKPTITDFELGPGSARESLLDRYHYWDETDGFAWDAFKYRDLMGRTTGWLLKRKGTGLSYGERSYLYPDRLGGDGTHLRVVEGPYDVVYPEDIAVGGLIFPHKVVKDLKPYSLILCPDGDVWDEGTLLKPFVLGLSTAMSSGAIIGVEYIPDGKDPDEVPKEDREFFGPKQLREIIKTVLRR